jgi:hypothetical protein
VGSIDVERYAAELAESLHDSSWQVRFNAAKVLRTYSRIDNLLLMIRGSGDQYAFEILDYMVRDLRMREVRV